jgi:hypothetical protein
MSGPLGEFNYGTGNENAPSHGIGGPNQGYNINNGLVQVLNAAGNAWLPYQMTVPTGTSQNHGSINVDKLGDDKVPYADTWSFGVAQALPSHTVAEFSYVGSLSRNQLENGNNGHIGDANAVAYGSYFMPDPITGLYENPAPCAKTINVGTPAVAVPFCTNNTANETSGFPTNDYLPLQNYQHVYVQSHAGIANYNSLQVSAQKQSGNLYLFTNFTFGKVLGTRDGSSSNGNGNGPIVNPFDLYANYGPLAYDHTKTFNVSFSYKLPKPIHNNWLAGEFVNGWQISGYTTYEDGAPYQDSSVNMNASYHTVDQAPGASSTTIPQVFTLPNFPANAVGGNQTTSIGYNTWVGSNQYPNGLQPVLVCDPRKGTKSGQYFNAACFVSPMGPTATTFGQLGQTIWPYIRDPHYFGSDLAIFKAFRVTDAQRVEVRISATNWLNHPNAGFGLNGSNNDNQLVFYGASTGSALVSNSNASTTGTPAYKTGYRWMQFAAKYYF